MKIIYIILLFIPMLCNELVFDAFGIDNVETNLVDSTLEEPSEKESSENSEDENKIEYLNSQNNAFNQFENLNKLHNHWHLSKWSIFIVDITCPPPEIS